MSRQWFRGMPDARGTAIFSPAQLDGFIREVVEPDVSPTHTLALVAVTTETGISAGLVLRKSVGLGAEWRVEAGFQHDWAGNNTVGAKLVWSL